MPRGATAPRQRRDSDHDATVSCLAGDAWLRDHCPNLPKSDAGAPTQHAWILVYLVKSGLNKL
jgi:hypothetical protein